MTDEERSEADATDRAGSPDELERGGGDENRRPGQDAPAPAAAGSRRPALLLLGVVLAAAFVVGGRGLLGRATGGDGEGGCGGPAGGVGTDRTGVLVERAVSASDCPSGWNLYGEAAGGFCCNGAISEGTCTTGAANICALDAARTQGNPLCSCPDGMAAFGSGLCCNGAVSNGACAPGATHVCARSTGDATHPFCGQCPEGTTRYAGFFCCRGSISADGGECVVGATTPPATMCALDADKTQALPICPGRCPAGMKEYGTSYCCNGVVSADGQQCLPVPSNSAYQVCALDPGNTQGLPTCQRSVCPDGSTLYASNYCCSGQVSADGNTCLAGAAGVCALLENDPNGNPTCNPCPFGTTLYGNGGYCCRGRVAPGGMACVAAEDGSGPEVCALDRANTQGNPVCNLRSTCPAGTDGYATSFCCKGHVNEARDTCIANPHHVCAMRSADPHGNPLCQDMTCPAGMTRYGNAVGGYFCCDGRVDASGSTCGQVADVCALNPNATQGNPLCIGTTFDPSTGTVVVGRPGSVFTMAATDFTDSGNEVTLSGTVTITTPAGPVELAGSSITVTKDPFGFSGTAEVPVPDFGPMAGVATATTPSASLALQRGSELGTIELGDEEMVADPEHYYLMFRYESELSLSLANTVTISSGGEGGALVFDPMEPMFYVSGDLLNLASVGRLSGAFAFSLAGRIPFTPAHPIWSSAAGALVDRAVQGHVFVEGSGELGQRLSVDGRMILDVDADDDGVTAFENAAELRDFEMAADVAATLDLSIGQLDFVLSPGTATVLVAGHEGTHGRVYFTARTPPDGIFADTVLRFLHPGDVTIYGYVEPPSGAFLNAVASGTGSITIGDAVFNYDAGTLSITIANDVTEQSFDGVRISATVHVPRLGSATLAMTIATNGQTTLTVTRGGATVFDVSFNILSGFASAGQSVTEWLENLVCPSYGRGVGQAPTSCGAGKQLDAGLCYPVCQSGYTGVGPVCWGTCAAGYRDDGATCHRDTRIVDANTSACPWYDKCNASCSTCPAGYHNDGCTCRVDVRTYGKPSYGRGVGVTPTGCPSGWQLDAGLCYPACNSGYWGLGPVCWKDGC